MYHLRITMSKCVGNYPSEQVFLKDVTEFLDNESKLWVCGFEGPPSDKQEHVHCHLEDLRIKVGSFRNLIRSKFGAGNGVWSLSKVKKSQVENIAYVIKRNRYTNSPNVSSDLLMEAENLCRNFQEEKEIQKKAKPTSTIKALRALCEEKKPFTVTQVVDIVMGYYRDNDLMIREFQIISQVHTLAYKYVSSFEPAFKANIMSRLESMLDAYEYRKNFPLSRQVVPDSKSKLPFEENES